MKTLLVVFCLFFSVVSQAEVISSISFNPSRMGEYTYLKVADKATLRGGLNATTLNISSGGTVSVTPDNSTRIYDVPTVSGESGSSIDMPSTAFHGNTSNTYTGYKSEDSSVPSGLLPNVKAQGGDLEFTQDSYISTLYAVDRLRQKVGGLVGDSFEITGNGGSTISLYESADTKGFYLAGNDIPEPVAAHTNTSTNLTSCILAWEKRKTSDSPAKEVWLLGLQGCNGAPVASCDTPPAGEKDYELCPEDGFTEKSYNCSGPTCWVVQGTKKTRTWNKSTCSWSAWSGTCCRAPNPNENVAGECGCNGTSVKVYAYERWSCNTSTGYWSNEGIDRFRYDQCLEKPGCAI